MNIVPFPTPPGALRKWLLYFALLTSFALVTWFWYTYMPMRSHWPEIFRPAIYKIFSFQTPYTNPLFYNPPWALIPLMPFALLPERLGWALLASTTFFAFAFTAHRMGARWYVILILLTLPQTLYNGLQVNVDWLVALGFLMPPKIGLFFIMMKPQLGAPLALLWLIESWREGGWRRVLQTFMPITIAFLISFAIFGFYPMGSEGLVLLEGKTFWPFSIPLGIALIVLSVRYNNRGHAIFSAPFISPYIQGYSLPFSLLGLLPSSLWTITGAATLWLYQFYSTPWMLAALLAPFLGH